MASGDSDARTADSSKIKQTLSAYKERSETSDCLRLTPFLKCIEACGLGQYKANIEASCWPQLQDKSKKISFDVIINDLIEFIAVDVMTKKKKLKNKVPRDDPEVQALANEIKLALEAKAGAAAVKAGKVDSTTARLTNVSGYTGSHKERFAADGKGKGIEGRKELVQNTGYVGNYKGSGTYDKKK